eukprot:3778651-Rhodomonas_salina.1
MCLLRRQPASPVPLSVQPQPARAGELLPGRHTAHRADRRTWTQSARFQAGWQCSGGAALAFRAAFAATPQYRGMLPRPRSPPPP